MRKFNISELIKIFQDGLVENNSQENAGRLLLDAIARDVGVDVSADMISSLVKQKINVHKKIRDASVKKQTPTDVIKYFEKFVVPDLNPVLMADLFAEIKRLLLMDNSVSVATQDRIVSLYEQDKIAEFLATAFIYAINKTNKVDQKKVRVSPAIDPVIHHPTLLLEVQNKCPFCHDTLMKVKNERITERYQIVTIYPNTLIALAPDEHLALINQEMLNNQIALCRDCAADYQADAIIIDCRELFDLKQSIVKKQNTAEMMNKMVLEVEIATVVEALLAVKNFNDLQPLSLEPLLVSEKIAPENIILLAEVTRDVAQYYRFIEASFAQVGDFNLIASEIQTAFYKLDAIYQDQAEIKAQLAEWIMLKTQLPKTANNLRCCHIVVSFFIQNCEVFYATAQ